MEALSTVETAAEAMAIALQRGFFEGGGAPARALAQTLRDSANGAPLDTPERSAAVELALRRMVMAYFSCPPSSRPAPLDRFLERLADVALALAEGGGATTGGGGGSSSAPPPAPPPAEPAVVFACLEDVFEAVPVSGLEAAWRVVEDRRQSLHPLVQGGLMKPRLALLRLTSGLLRRLSRTQDTVMCGKVLLFLAFIMPLSERSGVNVTGAFNVENSTAYEGGGADTESVVAPAVAHKPAAAPTPAPTRAPIKAGEGKTAAVVAPPASTPEPLTLDGRYALRSTYDAVHAAYLAAEKGEAASSPAFYASFWRLQHLLLHPSLAAGSVEAWNLFVGTLRAVLRGFETEDVEGGVATHRPGAPTSAALTAAAALASTKAGAGEGRGGKVGGGTDAKSPAPVGLGGGGGGPPPPRTLPPALPSLSLVTVAAVDRQAGSAGTAVSALVTMTGTGQRAAAGAPAAALSTHAGGRGGVGGGGEGGGEASGDKYLTSPSLLSLELRDASLRRHVLLQALLALQYHALPRKGEKDKPSAGSAGSDGAELREVCLTLLRRTAPDGPAFAAAVRGVLDREGYWNAWKQAGAADIAKTLQPAPSSVAKRSGEEAGLPSTAPSASKKFGRASGGAGSAVTGKGGRALTWASEGVALDLLGVCRDVTRAVRPSVQAYLVPYVMAMDPSMGMEAEGSPATDKTYTWRGLRLLGADALPALAQVSIEAAAAMARVEKPDLSAASGAAPSVGPARFRATVMSATGVRLREPELPAMEVLLPPPPPRPMPVPVPEPLAVVSGAGQVDAGDIEMAHEGGAVQDDEAILAEQHDARAGVDSAMAVEEADVSTGSVGAAGQAGTQDEEDMGVGGGQPAPTSDQEQVRGDDATVL